MSRHRVEISGSETVQYKRTIDMSDQELKEFKDFVSRCAIHGPIDSSDVFDVYHDIDEGYGMELDDVEIFIDGKDCSLEILGE